LDGTGTIRRVCQTDNIDHPKDIGDRSTLAIMLALRETGYALYVPFGETRVAISSSKKEIRFRVQDGKASERRRGVRRLQPAVCI
jgi:hypothetical protein